MRKTLLFLTAILVAAAVPAAAVENGFYIGGSVGGSSLEVEDFDEEFGAFRFSDGDTAYKLFAGFRFLNFLAVEAGYVDLGDPQDIIASIEGDELEVRIGVNGWDAFAIGLLPIGPVDLFVKVGVVSWEADIRAAYNDLRDADSDTGTDAAYGIGVGLRLGGWALRAEGEQFDIGNAEDVYMFSVGATYTF
jgi:OOP family OmpA-OmpF porin